MVNEDILGGIEEALLKGESLESAMISFYNSGYSKEDIEWAAKAFQIEESVKNAPKEELLKKQISSREENKFSQQVIKTPSTKVVQNVSSYEASQFKEKVLLIVLIASFLTLLGILAGIFVFKEQVVDFFNGLFA